MKQSDESRTCSEMATAPLLPTTPPRPVALCPVSTLEICGGGRRGAVEVQARGSGREGAADLAHQRGVHHQHQPDAAHRHHRQQRVVGPECGGEHSEQVSLRVLGAHHRLVRRLLEGHGVQPGPRTLERGRRGRQPAAQLGRVGRRAAATHVVRAHPQRQRRPRAAAAVDAAAAEEASELAVQPRASLRRLGAAARRDAAGLATGAGAARGGGAAAALPRRAQHRREALRLARRAEAVGVAAAIDEAEPDGVGLRGERLEPAEAREVVLELDGGPARGAPAWRREGRPGHGRGRQGERRGCGGARRTRARAARWRASRCAG